jgi:hypothetical protein
VPVAAEAVAGDAVWGALVAAGVVPEPYAEPAPPPDALVPLSVVAERLKAAGVWEAIVELVFDPANRSALADLIMVQQGIAPNDPVARALISAAGADPEWSCGRPSLPVPVIALGARQSDFANAELDTGSIPFVLDGHVWSNNGVRVTARNVSASTVDLAAAPLVCRRRSGESREQVQKT